MHVEPWLDPSLAVAVALAAGVAAQALARHLRVPGIVVLLAAGVVLGPDVLGWLRPTVLGDSLNALVGFAVAVILFEGALNLDLKRLRQQARSIRRLVTIGAAITTIGGALIARYLLGWDWRLSILFGTLVIVTGPTVINPLVRRIRLQQHLATVLEGEGVFGDAIGALVAVVALEVAVSPTGDSLLHGPLELAERLGIGALTGFVAGLLLGFLLRQARIVPSGMENVFILSAVWLVFHGANSLLPESGIVAVIAAGATVANFSSRQLEDLREFKEQLTLLMLGMLFVLLAADVRVAEVRSLGWAGLGAVACLMFVVRPLNVLASTAGTSLSGRERTFLMWLAPRGIVAAAVASLFAQSLATAGIPGGTELRAMVFLVIAVTVNVQGPTGGWIASLLGVRRSRELGYVILGANPLGRLMGQAMQQCGKRVLFIDSNPQACEAAETDGFRVLYGSGLSERSLKRAQLEERDGCLAMTTNDEANFAFCRRVRLEFGVSGIWLPRHRGSSRLTASMLEEIGAQTLFGGPRSLDRWARLLESSAVTLERWRYSGEAVEMPLHETFGPGMAMNTLPLIHQSGRRCRPFDQRTKVRDEDRILVAIASAERDAVVARLESLGWSSEPNDAD